VRRRDAPGVDPEAKGGVDDAIVFDAADQALQLLPRA